MRNTYAPALVLVAVIVPIPVFATVITVVIYVILGQQFGLAGWLNWVALLSGLSVTLIAWLIGGIFCRRLATARYSNKLSYDAILQELRRLEMNFDTIEVNDPEEASELEEVIESAATVQAVKVAGTDEVAVTAHAVGVVSATEANGAVEPTPASHDTGALQRAYAALYGDNEDERIENCLQVNGLQWIRSTGYIDIWNRLHAADQEMTVLLPKETLEIDADYDLLRLDGSTIPNSQHWIDTINTAKATLERVDKQKRAKKALEDHTQQAAKEQQLLGQAMLDLIKATVSSPELPLDEAHIPKSFGPALFSILKSAFSDPPPEVHQTEEQARADLRQARIAINTYVTNRWVGLIASRNRLIATSFFASIFIYLLFVVAMLANAPASALVAGLVFYFVGAVAGLFPRLAPKMTRSNQPSKAPNPPPKADNTSKVAGKPAKATSQSNSAKANGNGKSTVQKGSARPNTPSSDDSPPSDDYGLTMARVLITPVFSGLAALIGVGLATLLSITLVTLTPAQSGNSASVATPTAVVATVTPTAAVSSATAPTSRTVPNYPSLDQVYSLTTNVQGVIFAVIFGFLPSLVINALQKEASLMMGQLKSTDPGEDGGG
ncbi:MAG TPA: hypothetical protein VJ761_20905 [Ktedonobacteraceae bacterium]|nr:hypothetical protein [Ktedonobacteraceae bacterium]